MFKVSNFTESQRRIVLSREQVMIFGSSYIFSFDLSSNLLGSSAMILRMESVCPSMSWVF